MARTGLIISALAGLAAMAVGQAAMAQPGGISVISGTYGRSCGVRPGNVTRDLRRNCDGRQRCDYVVDVNRLGDPAPGCRKDYIAQWRCPDGQTHQSGAGAEAGFGSVVRLECWGPGPGYDRDHGDYDRDHGDHDAYDHGPPVGPRGGITVLSATYGRSCRVREGNVTRDLAMACNGRGDCEYRVDVNRLGDPAPNCPKDYVARWQCPDGRQHETSAAPEAGFGSIVRLSCYSRR